MYMVTGPYDVTMWWMYVGGKGDFMSLYAAESAGLSVGLPPC